jgi:hypothetical protein
MYFFADLCESFALFAVQSSYPRKFNRKGRKGFAKGRKGSFME